MSLVRHDAYILPYQGFDLFPLDAGLSSVIELIEQPLLNGLYFGRVFR